MCKKCVSDLSTIIRQRDKLLERKIVSIAPVIVTDVCIFILSLKGGFLQVNFHLTVITYPATLVPLLPCSSCSISSSPLKDRKSNRCVSPTQHSEQLFRWRVSRIRLLRWQCKYSYRATV